MTVDRDESVRSMVTPKFPFKLNCSSMKKTALEFLR